MYTSEHSINQSTQSEIPLYLLYIDLPVDLQFHLSSMTVSEDSQTREGKSLISLKANMMRIIQSMDKGCNLVFYFYIHQAAEIYKDIMLEPNIHRLAVSLDNTSNVRCAVPTYVIPFSR